MTAAAGPACIAFAGATGWQLTERVRAIVTPAPRGAWTFCSRPDLRPPAAYVVEKGRGLAPGYVFLAPKTGPDEQGPGQDGTMIVDDDGRLVWFRPAPPGRPDTMDFRTQTYRGRPVLTWWEGIHGGFGSGEYVIFDSSYWKVKPFPAGNGHDGDHHEFVITPRDTALVTIYSESPLDLSAYGGPTDGLVIGGVAQEIEIVSGEVLFEWHSLEHVDPSESYYEPDNDPTSRFDYFHINSIGVDDDGNWLVSARRTSAVYEIDRQMGEVIWCLGGEKSDFEMGPGAGFAYQHDARRQADGAITLFDNYGTNDTTGLSHGIVLEVDEYAMKATLLREYTGGAEGIADTQGNMQSLPNGNVFAGWGSEPFFSEFDGEGNFLFNAGFEPWWESCRAFRLPWGGQPDDGPAVVAEAGSGDRVTLCASWNGATEVASWRLLAGPTPDELEVLGTVPRRGFETVIEARVTEPYVCVQAVTGSGRAFGPTTAVRPEKRRTGSS